MTCTEARRCGGAGCPFCGMADFVALSDADKISFIKRQQTQMLRGASMRHSACSGTGCSGCTECATRRTLGIPPHDQRESNRAISDHVRNRPSRNPSTVAKRQEQEVARAKREQVAGILRDGVPEVQ